MTQLYLTTRHSSGGNKNRKRRADAANLILVRKLPTELSGNFFQVEDYHGTDMWQVHGSELTPISLKKVKQMGLIRKEQVDGRTRPRTQW